MTGALRQLSKAIFAAGDRFLLPQFRGPRILIYHQIGGGSGLEMEVSPGTFKKHLDWLVENGNVVRLEDASGSDDVVITFDDGYRSVYDVAFPLLEERGMPFTLFLTTSPLETGEPLRSHPGGHPLTWDMVREMHDSGLMTVGGHTHTHPDFRHLSPSEVEEELDRSNGLIEKRLDTQPRYFAYTWGYWSPTADAAVRRRYEHALLGGPPPFPNVEDPHLLYRIPVQLSDGVRWFSSRIRGGLRWEEAFRRRLRGYRGP